jgi:hypothetical protein
MKNTGVPEGSPNLPEALEGKSFLLNQVLSRANQSLFPDACDYRRVIGIKRERKERAVVSGLFH